MLAQNDLVSEGLPVVVSVCRRLARRLGRSVSIDDLIGIGNLALLGITRTWDPARATFVAYATWRLKFAILDGLRRETHGRIAAARATALIASEHLSDAWADKPDPDAPTTQEEDQAALSDLLAGHAAALAVGLVTVSRDEAMHVDTPEEEVERAELARVVKDAILSLPERERALMERHYYGGEAFEAIAGDLGISKSWASRLHERAILAVKAAVDPEGPAEDP
jgi:RNA polymerase sigma factor for flagellar operon FliA